MTPSPCSDLRLEALFRLLQRHSFQRGDFVLSSGKRSDYYLDGRMTTLSAEGSALIGAILTDMIRPLGITAVGGLTLGADPIVTAITVVSAQQGHPLNGFLIRKAAKGHGTGRQVEGHLRPGDRVVLVEDVMTSGQSFLTAVEAVRAVSSDIEIVKLLALVDRMEGGQAALAPLGIPVEALFPVDAFLAATAPATSHPAG